MTQPFDDKKKKEKNIKQVIQLHARKMHLEISIISE